MTVVVFFLYERRITGTHVVVVTENTEYPGEIFERLGNLFVFLRRTRKLQKQWTH